MKIRRDNSETVLDSTRHAMNVPCNVRHSRDIICETISRFIASFGNRHWDLVMPLVCTGRHGEPHYRDKRGVDC